MPATTRDGSRTPISWPCPRPSRPPTSRSWAAGGGCGSGAGPKCWPPSASRRRVVAVAGTHGKTTTSSMLAVVLEGAGRHPSYVIGGDIVGVGPGAALGCKGEWLVVEADESDGTFLALGAEAAVVTSVEPDHLDFYGDEAAMRQAFERFVVDAPGPGSCAPTRRGRPAWPGVRCRHLRDVRRPPTSGSWTWPGGGRPARFCMSDPDGTLGPFRLAAPGMHNVRNATAALATAHALGVGWEPAAAALDGYRGVARRFETRGGRAGSRSSTTTATCPAKWRPSLPPPGRGVDEGRGRVPAPPVLADRGAVGRLRRRVRRRRRAGGHRHLPGRRTGPAGHYRAARRRRRPRRPPRP